MPGMSRKSPVPTVFIIACLLLLSIGFIQSGVSSSNSTTKSEEEPYYPLFFRNVEDFLTSPFLVCGNGTLESPFFIDGNGTTVNHIEVTRIDSPFIIANFTIEAFEPDDDNPDYWSFSNLSSGIHIGECAYGTLSGISVKRANYISCGINIYASNDIVFDDCRCDSRSYIRSNSHDIEIINSEFTGWGVICEGSSSSISYNTFIGCGIHFQRTGSYCEVIGNLIDYTYDDGGYLETGINAGSYNTISHNCIIGGKIGISGTRKNIISDNNISSQGYDISISGDYNSVLNNSMNGYGLSFASGTENTYLSNTIHDEPVEVIQNRHHDSVAIFAGQAIVDHCSNLTISGSIVHGGYNALRIECSSDILLHSFVVSGYSVAVWVTDSRNFSMEDCRIENSIKGVMGLNTEQFGRISGSRFDSNNRSLHLQDVPHACIENNLFTNSTDSAIYVMHYQRFYRETSIFLFNNTFRDNKNGVQALEYDIIAVNNSFQSNIYGMYINVYAHLLAYRNTISGNVVGIYFCGGRNIVVNNNFINNSCHVKETRYYSNIYNWNETIGGNYWSDASPFTDEDNDGYCDSPYVIADEPKTITDELPLVDTRNGWLGNYSQFTYPETYGEMCDHSSEDCLIFIMMISPIIIMIILGTTLLIKKKK